MIQIYPPNEKLLTKWLTKTVLHLSDSGLIETEAQERIEMKRLEIFGKIKGLPEELYVIRSSAQTWYTFLPEEYAKSLFSGKSLDHIPIATLNSLKILDSAGDIITSLYFPKNVLSSMVSTKFMTLESPPYSFVSVKCQSVVNRQDESYYEILMDRDETIMYRAVSPFAGCALRDGEVLFRIPSLPIIHVQPTDDYEVRVFTETRKSRVITGSLLKVSLALIPFPYYIFTFTDCQIDGKSFDDIDVPSFLLYGADAAMTEDELYALNRQHINEVQENRDEYNQLWAEMLAIPDER